MRGGTGRGELLRSIQVNGTAVLFIALFLWLIFFLNGLEEETQTPTSPEPVPVITEVMAANRSILMDEEGDCCDWIEIYNPGIDSINLQGYGLSDNPDKPFKWKFPSVEIPTQQYLIVFASGKEMDQGGKAFLHASFRLNAREEPLIFSHKDGRVLQRIQIKTAPPDISYGCAADDVEEWLYYDRPTPGGPNDSPGEIIWESKPKTLDSHPLLINEYMAENQTFLLDEKGDLWDWVELYNSGEEPIDLEGYGLSDNPKALLKWQFPSMELAPGEYLIVFASGRNLRSPLAPFFHTNFRLNPRGESLFLSNPEGLIINQLIIQSTPSRVSYGRDMKDPEEWLYFTQPTPGRPNDTEGFKEFLINEQSLESKELMISEVMNLNRHSLRDEDGEYSDWIELYNPGDNPINLKGYGLSTRVRDPFLWVFPDCSLEPREYLVIFASGKNRTGLEGDPLHTSFRLDAAGETLLITHPDGRVLDILSTGELGADVSSGRKIGQSGRFFFTEATPGSLNEPNGFSGYAMKPRLSQQGGFYDQPLAVDSLTASPKELIRFTLDGSDPTEASPVLDAPLMIEKTTVVRLKAYEEGKLPSPTATYTFFIGVRHVLPVVSAVTDPLNLWDHDNGIYVMGPKADEEFPYVGANFWKDMEKPVHIELYDEKGRQGFGMDAGIKIFGAYSRAMPQKSFAIFARSEYGADTLYYPLFEDKPITAFSSIVLRTSGQDAVLSKIRDAMMGRLIKDTGLDYQAYCPVILYLNGEYWGLYNIREKVNEDYLAANHGADPDKIDLLVGNGKVLAGDFRDYRDLINFVETHDMSLDKNYAYVKERMDVDNFIDYQVSIIYFGNTDTGNIKFWREQGPEGRWRWIVYDQDWGFFNVKHDTLSYVTNEEGTGVGKRFSTSLMVNLLKNENFKKDFLERLAYRLQHTFNTEHVLKVIDEMAETIRPEMPGQLERWGGSMRGWKNQLQVLRSFAIERPKILKKYIQSKFNLTQEEMERFEEG